MAEPVEGITRTLARYVTRTRFDDFPASVQAEGARAFVNWFGCVLGGCRMPAVETAAGLFELYSGPRQATVIGRGMRIDPLGAAFLNSMSNASRSFNDTHLRTVAHPTASVAAAILALAETRQVSGRAFMEALILGVELQCRIGNVLVTPPAESHFSLSMIGLVGGVGAAVASAKLLGVDEQRMLYAIGLALAQSGGTRATHGSMGGRMLSGEAARAGLMSALLAERGFTSPEEVISGSKGYAAAYAKGGDPNIAVAGLGVDYEISSLAYKPYPCGIVIHPIIDVCLDLVRQYGFMDEDIVRIDIEAPQSALDLTGRRNPTDGNTAGTSLYHWAAATIIHRTAGLQQASNECVLDPRVIALRERIHATVDRSMGPQAARGAISLKDGRVLRHEVKLARGCAQRPLTNDELSEKFMGQASLNWSPSSANLALQATWSLTEADDVASHLAQALGAFT